MSIDLSKWGPVTVLVVGLAFLVAAGGLVVVIVEPSTLSFNDYLNDLWKFAGAAGLAGVGRGIHLGLAKRPAPVMTTSSRRGATMTALDLTGGAPNTEPQTSIGGAPTGNEDVPDDEEFSNVPRVESGITPQPPDGERAGQDAVPPLEPGDYEEG